jgi:hypothetical protein
VTGVHPVGIAALVEQRSRALLASLRVMSLGEADVARVLDEPAEQVPARGFAAMATA